MIKTATGQVFSSWIDSNMHVNIVFYHKILNKALEKFCSVNGSINFILPKNFSYVAKEIFINYSNEIVYPSYYFVKSGLIEINHSGFISFHCLYSNGTICTRFFVKSIFFNLNSRRSEHLAPEEIKKVSLPLEKDIKSPFSLSK